MLEPIDLIKERLSEIKQVLDTITEDNYVELNELTELYNRYIVSYNLLNNKLNSKRKNKTLKPNKNALLLYHLSLEKRKNGKLREKIRKYYNKWYFQKNRYKRLKKKLLKHA